MRISDYSKIVNLSPTDVFLVNTDTGTKTIKASDLISALSGMEDIPSVLTENDIGSTVTATGKSIPSLQLIKSMSDLDEVMFRELKAPYGYFGIEQDLDELMFWVRAGAWDKFAIGDYFIETTTANEKIQWEVAGKNLYLHYGGTEELKKNHIVCCPRDCLEKKYAYNTTNSNAGGYAASLMSGNLETEASKFSTKLKGYMTWIDRLENNKGAWAWAKRKIILPSIIEIFGTNGFADGFSGGASIQLPLFSFGSAHIYKGRGFNKANKERDAYWTADPSGYSTTAFCTVNGDGANTDTGAIGEASIAPLIILS